MSQVILEVRDGGGCILRTEMWLYFLAQLLQGKYVYGGDVDDLEMAVIVDGTRIVAEQPEAMENET